MNPKHLFKLLLFALALVVAAPEHTPQAQAQGLLDAVNQSQDKKDKEKKEKKSKRSRRSKNNKKNKKDETAEQAPVYNLKVTYEKLSKEYNDLRNAYWEKKKVMVDEKERLNNKLINVKEASSKSFDSKNSQTQELYLINEKLAQMKEKKSTVLEERESFESQIGEIIFKEEQKLGGYYPYLLESSILRMNQIKAKLNSKDFIGAIIDLFKHKEIVVRESETAEVGTKKINPKEKGDDPIEESTYLRLGFIHETYAQADMAGMLLRNISLKGIFYDWEENLPNDLTKRLQSAVNAAFISAGENTEPIKVPVDITQAGGKLLAIVEGNSGGLLKRFVSFFRSGGLIMYPLFLIALVSMVIMAERIMFYLRTNKRGNLVLNNVVSLVQERKITEARQLCSKHESSISSIISPILSDKLNRERAENSLDESFSQEVPKLQKRLPTLAVLSAVAPLLGLLGTVSGMIALFDVITIYGTSNPKILAGGISIALITTQTGLSIAIPIMLVHHLLGRAKTFLTNKVEYTALNILNLLYPTRKEQKT